MTRMYNNVETWNPFVGCEHECSYCYACRIAKRQKHRCNKCYNFVPHMHPERLTRKFKEGETIFVSSMGDISFASFEQFNQILEVISYYPNTTFYIQSKNPVYFNEYIKRYSSDVRSNTVLGTTIETNYTHYFNHYATETVISKAPYPVDRKNAMVKLPYQKYLTEFSRYVTIEPIMEFDLDIMVEWIREINPEFVYVGYNNQDSKNFHLPEPKLEKTLQLIKELEQITEVREKTIRKAWWEIVNENNEDKDHIYPMQHSLL